MDYSKLDKYDYTIDDNFKDKYHNDIEVKIKIKDQGKYDATIADISTDITSKDNLVYVEGRHFVASSVTAIGTGGSSYSLEIIGKTL